MTQPTGPRPQPPQSPQQSLPRGLRQRLNELPATLLRLRATAEQRLPVITRFAAQLVRINILDVATRLAAQIFLTALPLLFVVAAFAPQGVRNQLVDSLREVFGLSGAPLDQLQSVYQGGNDSFVQTTGVIGVLVALASATVCARVLQRLCERSWELPKSGTRIAAWRWFIWVCSWILIMIAQQPLRTGFGAGLWLGIPLSFAAGVLEWWWTQHLLLGARARWLPLLPGALLGAVAMTALSLTAKIYMPIAINNSQNKFGGLGPVFTLLSWLIVICAAVVGSISLGQVVATEPPVSHWLGPVLREQGPAGPAPRQDRPPQPATDTTGPAANTSGPNADPAGPTGPAGPADPAGPAGPAPDRAGS
ncbi:ribonuclease BN [Streptacidiphilus cavernicola]|uniref:Ribonuclease BN n=1 Tax=Streptacidiphilus cavernicola TaxID=3342716 RepID=A0ABV6W0M2_9ACTN